MKLRILCTALLIFPALAMACVNTRNGDFCASYKDITQNSWDHELSLTRTYNSKISGIGWFGYGWGSTFETRMMVMPDGSVAVQENGTGQISYYTPKGGSHLKEGVDKIVAMAIQHDKLDAEAAEVLRNKLLTDEGLRRANVAKYEIQTPLPTEGAQSSACPAAGVIRINDEYRRTTCGKGIDYFDLAGRMIRKEENGYKLTVHYVGKYPDRIDDSLGQKISLKWTADGHVAEASTVKPERIMEYSYDDKDNLLMSSQRDGDTYQYKYDDQHNMTQVGYADQTHMDMQYDNNDRIASMVEADGAKITYTYRYDPANPSSHYWTNIIWISATGKQSSRENEFLLSTDAAGVEQLARMTKREGEKTEDIQLDERGRFKRVQRFDGRLAEYFYHPTANKPSAVVTDEGGSLFQYDKAGNLIRIYSSKGLLIKLDYDSRSRINRMIETDKAKHTRRELTFKYNALGKPTRIRLVGKGEINVNYDEQGEISKVESKQGAAMALGVVEAFQALLGVVKVEAVDICL